MSNDLFSKRNKVLAVTALVGFSVVILTVGSFALNNQMPSLIKETGQENNFPKPNFKNDLKIFNDLYGIERDKILLPEFIELPGGKFLMGSTEGIVAEQPQHEITINAFSITRTEITNAQYLAFCQITKRKLPQDPRWQGLYMRDYPNHPIVAVSWEDAVAYSSWLGTVIGKEVRLPTEAEWEYAAQGSKPGTTLEFATRELLPTTKVASYPPSQLGMFDMLGNVWEWCLDWHSPLYYSESPKENPQGPTEGQFKSIRGGSWAESFNASRVTHRNRALPASGSPTIGFRVIISNKSS